MIAALCRIPEGRSALPSWWQPIANRSLDAGIRDILGCLTGRGLTPTQIQGWTGYDSAVHQQSVYWAWQEGGPLQNNVPQLEAEPLDLREWLMTVTLTDANGDLIIPDPGRLVGHGPIAGAWDDVKVKTAPYRRIGVIDPTGAIMNW